VLTPELRAEMGRCAVDVARACQYAGAGTVEFLLDDQHRFYFLEMNTRLQVEHPVTEQITGLDLVKEQIRVAEGQPLPFRQEDLTITGHALELRVYAEDPQNNFLPDIGRLATYVRPQGPGVRVDDGFEQGMDIPIYYDPMIAKLVTTGATRQEAIDRMLRAIAEYQITGIETTLPFGAFVLKHPAFVSGNFDTNFVRDHFSAAVLAPTTPDEGTAQVAAALVAMLMQEKKPASPAAASEVTGAPASAWRRNRLGVG
jgi:acetyl-CoA carboxylase biotin carboxylase subunit